MGLIDLGRGNNAEYIVLLGTIAVGAAITYNFLDCLDGRRGSRNFEKILDEYYRSPIDNAVGASWPREALEGLSPAFGGICEALGGDGGDAAFKIPYANPDGIPLGEKSTGERVAVCGLEGLALAMLEIATEMLGARLFAGLEIARVASEQSRWQINPMCRPNKRSPEDFSERWRPRTNTVATKHSQHIHGRIFRRDFSGC